MSKTVPTPRWTEQPLNSGGSVRYREKPRREYQIRAAEGAPWVTVPSVTTILGILDKPALPWWGMKMGVEGVLRLCAEHGERLSAELLEPFDLVEVRDEMVKALTEHKLTVNHIRDAGGARGQSVHDAFELWLETGMSAHVESYPEHERGYLTGFQAFCADIDYIGPARSEFMVGSLIHLYAGRGDCGTLEQFSGNFVVDRETGERADVEGRVMIDLKTSKRAYASHFLQMRGYEAAMVEDGEEEFTDRYVLLVDANGKYELVNSQKAFKADFTWDDFFAVRAVYAAVGGKL